MSTNTPLFPVVNPSKRSPRENIRVLSDVCHVVEVKGVYALVHASPMGVVKITELGLGVFHSKRGGEYYAVRIGEIPTSVHPSSVRITIWDSQYLVNETSPKRRKDVRRFEIRKDDGGVVAQPYVVAFQDNQGHSGACSCPDWIYRRRDCKHIRSIRTAFLTMKKAA